MRPWSQPVRALTWAIRPDSSVGQSSCLVNSRSSVRIRLRAPKPLQLQRSEHSSVCSINGRATLRATNPPGREWWRVVGAVETGPMETGYQPLPPPTTKTDCFWGFLIAGRICLTNNIQSSRAVKLFSIDRRSASRCPVPGARCPVPGARFGCSAHPETSVRSRHLVLRTGVELVVLVGIHLLGGHRLVVAASTSRVEARPATVWSAALDGAEE